MPLDSRLTSRGNFYFPVDGHFVSEKQIQINEILQDYDPTLQLQWIPPDKRSAEDLAFRVVQFPTNGTAPYLVCVAEEADERLLARVFEADQQRGPNRLSFIENYNNARELLIAKQEQEQRAEDHEMAVSILRNQKSYYRHGGVNFERAGGRNSGKTYIW
ncbi:hypothetical protein [Chitinophaga sp.]|uniref:hypothetical protein n=1 Tax=Chitinophaga sp. TaxID=1869181 RepID=UPI002F93A42A